MAEIFPELTEEVVGRMKGAPARFQEVMTQLIRHLHAFVRDVGLTQEEWSAGIDFLTRTGQMCSDSRQEFILLSDILGVSMLVDAVANHAGAGLTDSTVLGPFYTGRQRVIEKGGSILLRDEPGEALVMCGRVADVAGVPIAGAHLEVWQTASNRLYDVQDESMPRGHLRATLTTDLQGEYAFRTVVPVYYSIPDDGPAGELLEGMGRHPYRPAHVHFIVSAPGCRKLVTHLFLAGDRYLDSDAVFGVKPSLIVTPTLIEGVATVEYDFGLDRLQAA